MDAFHSEWGVKGIFISEGGVINKEKVPANRIQLICLVRSWFNKRIAQSFIKWDFR